MKDVRTGAEGKTHGETLLAGSGCGSGLASSLLKTCFYYVLLEVCVSLHGCAHLSTVPLEARRGHQLPGAGVKGEGELPDMDAGNCNLGPLQDQYVFLIAEPFLQSLLSFLVQYKTACPAGNSTAHSGLNPPT